MRFVFIFFLFLAPLFAKVVLQDTSLHYDNFEIQYLDDKTDTLTIEEIAKTPFVDSTRNSFTFGYKSHTTWFKIEILNRSSSSEYVLAFKEVVWKKFDFYYVKDGRWIEEKNGLSVPLVDRKIKDVNPAFEFFVDSNKTAIIYVKAKTTSGQLGKFEIFTHDEYFNPTRITTLKIYLLFGFMLAGILLLNLYSLYLTRELTYVYYVTYIIISLMSTSVQSGSYLILGLKGWSEGLHTIGALLVVFLLLFTDRFLEFKRELLLIHRFLIFSVAILFVFTSLLFYNVSGICLSFNLFSIVVFSVLLIGVVKTLLKGKLDAKLYLLALIIYMFLMGFMIATFNTLLPYYDISRHAFVVGGFIEIMLFTFILTSRYRTVTLEKIHIQDELLHEKSKNEAYLEAEIAKRTEELEYLASTDPMTKLYNRRYFKEISQSMLDLAKRNETDLCTMMLDIDNFKSINDDFGHSVGDEVIITIGKILQEQSRKSDVISRWGGEEFLILLPYTTIEGAMHIAEKIRINVENAPLTLHDNSILKFTISIGVSVVDIVDDMSLESSINRADKALYEAKEHGKNRVVKFLR